MSENNFGNTGTPETTGMQGGQGAPQGSYPVPPVTPVPPAQPSPVQPVTPVTPAQPTPPWSPVQPTYPTPQSPTPAWTPAPQPPYNPVGASQPSYGPETTAQPPFNPAGTAQPPYVPPPGGAPYPYATAPAGGPGYWGQATPPPPPPKSKAWILILVVVVVLALIGGLIYIANRPSTPVAPTTTSGTSTEPTTSPTKVAINSAQVGDCFDTDTLDDDDYLYIRPLDCHSPHDGEIFFVDAVDSPTYPGSNGWDDTVDDLCVPAFGDYVGEPYWSSDLYLSYVYPNESDWDNGDHILICYVYDNDNVTTPMQGSGR